MTLLSHISSVISISKELEAEINSVSKKIKFKKGENIIDIDERCSNLYFIEKGLVRGYYFDEAKNRDGYMNYEKTIVQPHRGYLLVEKESNL